MGRLLFISSLLIFTTLVEIFHWFFMGMDHLFFSSFRKVIIREPVFITGMPRTGSSFFFRTLTADSDRFSAMRLWEILLAPSIVQKKILLLLRKLDRQFGNHLYRRWLKMEQRLFREVDSIHPMSFHNVEEDEFLFLHRGNSASVIFLFPGNKSTLRFARFDELVPTAKRASLMRFYKKCIQRHLYIFGAGRQYLAKSASHTPRMLTLRESFPDCRLIYLYRSPMEAIPSTLSLFRFILKTFHSRVDISELQKFTLDMADHWYTYPLRIRREQGHDLLYIIRFNDMTAKIRDTVHNMYRAFHYDMDEEYNLYLAETGKNRRISRHQYSLDEFSLSDKEIRERYQDEMFEYESK